jgi:hypothetical protein
MDKWLMSTDMLKKNGWESQQQTQNKESDECGKQGVMFSVSRKNTVHCFTLQKKQ